MKLIWDRFQNSIAFLIIATFISIALILCLAPIYYRFYFFSILLFGISWSCFLLKTCPKLLKLAYLLNTGIYTKAKIIDIKENKSKVIFYCEFLTPKNKHVIVKRSITYWEYYKEMYSLVKVTKEELPIERATNSNKKNHEIPIVSPPSGESNIIMPSEYSHLMVNSTIGILYDPENPKNCMLCPLWDVWRRNHLLDDYPQHIKDQEEPHKQRKIKKTELFSNLFEIRRLWMIIFPIVLVISYFINIGIFVVLLLIGAFITLTLRIFICNPSFCKKNHEFYEYSVATTGIITSANEVIERTSFHNQDEEKPKWIYTYIFTTEDETPYQGKIEVSPTPDIRPYEKDSLVTVLYDPYCIAYNCLAFYYPYSWIQPEETKDLYRISIIEPEENYYVPEDTNNIAEDTNNFSEDTTNIQEDTNNIAEDTNNFSEDTTNIQEDTNNIAEDTNNIQEDTNNIQEDTNNIAEDTNNIQENSNNF